MKEDYLIPLVLIIGLGVMFFFPNPENHIIPYAITFLFFIILISLIIWLRNKK